MLSRWKTKGKYACPCCNYETGGEYFYGSEKMCYMINRKKKKKDDPLCRGKNVYYF